MVLANGALAQAAAAASEPKPVLPQIALPPVPTGPPPATSQLDAYLFLPKSPLASPAGVLPKESRTPAQLQALLSNYVGTWRGAARWYSNATGHLLQAPAEMVYTLKVENGRKVLACTITYSLPAGPSVALSRTWVESGHIFSEITQGDSSQRFIAQSTPGGLIWRTFDSMSAVLEFSEVETLRLTPDGGELSSSGYEVQHYARGDSLVFESADLTLVKPN